MPHQIQVPDHIYEWAKAKGAAMGIGWATFLRDVIDIAHIHDVQNENTAPVLLDASAPPTFESRWAAMGCADDQFDLYFTNEAKPAFIAAHGDEETALTWMERGYRERGINSPRAFIISWYRKSTGAAPDSAAAQ